MAATFSLQSPDGELWHLDDCEDARIVRIENDQLYRVEPVVEAQNGWYRVTAFRIADLMESQRLGSAVVHTSREVLRSVTGRFGFRTQMTTTFDGRVVEEAVAQPDPGGTRNFGPLGHVFAAAWAPFEAMLAPALEAYPPQPTTPWDPRLAS